MPATIQTWGLARKNILDVFEINEKKQEKQYEWLLGNNFNTTQQYETFKQMKGLSPASQTPEGEEAVSDDYSQLYARPFYPVLFTKLLEYTELADFTLQYKDILNKQGDFAKAFVARRNIVAANVHNLGFTNATYGMNSEYLYQQNHSMGGGYTGSNRPSTDIALSYLAVQQMMIEIRQQKTAVGQPAMLTGPIRLMVPTALEGKAIAIVNSMQTAGNNNNDTNKMIRERITLDICDYFTSNYAWFGKMVDNSLHGLFKLDQLPYRFDKLAMTKAMMLPYVARESYVVGWKDWHGTWGTTGV